MTQTPPRTNPMRIAVGDTGMQLEIGLTPDGREVYARLYIPDHQGVYQLELPHVTAAAISHGIRTYASEAAIHMGEVLKPYVGQSPQAPKVLN